MSEDLRDAVEQGVPLAVLTASEGSIYGRFGFGPAVFQHSLVVDTGPRFALRGPADEGSVELLEPVDAWPTVTAVFARFHERTRGSVERPRFYETILTGEFDFEDGADQKLRTAVHLDAAGTPDGYVAYRPGPRKDGHRAINVSDLVALTPAAYLRLWRFLADLDLSDTVEWDRAPVDDPLSWALVDPFLAKVTRQTDALWVRVLDVPAALAARPWGRDGEVVLEVADPLGHAAGRFRVVTRDGVAEVTTTDADVGSPAGRRHPRRSLPGRRARGAAPRAGRLSGTEAGLATWATMVDAGPAPLLHHRLLSRPTGRAPGCCGGCAPARPGPAPRAAAGGTSRTARGSPCAGRTSRRPGCPPARPNASTVPSAAGFCSSAAPSGTQSPCSVSHARQVVDRAEQVGQLRGADLADEQRRVGRLVLVHRVRRAPRRGGELPGVVGRSGSIHTGQPMAGTHR